MKVDYFDGNDIIINNTGRNLGLRNKSHFIMKGKLFNNFTKFEGEISVVDHYGMEIIISLNKSILIYTQG